MPRRNFYKRSFFRRHRSDLKLLCDRCSRTEWSDVVLFRTTGWIEETENKSLFKGIIQDLVQRQPCAFCSLVLHLVSARDAKSTVDLFNVTKDSELLRKSYEVKVTYPFLGGKTMILSVHCGNNPGTMDHSLKGTIVRIEPSLNPFRRTIIPKQLGQSQIDTRVVLSWIQNCNEHHEHCKIRRHESLNRERPVIRLIDVRSKRLIKMREPVKYMALSYVWGNTTMFRTQKKDLKALEEVDGLSSYWNRLGQTIQDAILFVSSLNERYLWVDAICIIQDDADEMRTQISQMDSIYNHAFLTLIALSATDANSDLPGVRFGTRSATGAAAIVQGHVLSAQPPSGWTDIRSSSAYDTRAWTFQESVLSSRCLFFSEKRVIFQCLQSVEMEHLLPEQSSERPSPEHINPLVNLLSPFRNPMLRVDNSSTPYTDFMRSFYLYQILTTNYARRKLTYPSDILNAFSGVMGMLERRGAGPFIYGLPESSLDLALLWTHGSVRGIRRRNLGDNSTNTNLPSWTWAAWSGPVRWDLFPPRESNYTDETDGSPSIQPTLTHLSIQEGEYIRPIITVTRSILSYNMHLSISKDDTTNRFLDHQSTIKTGVLRFRAWAAPFTKFGLFSEISTPDTPPHRFITFRNRVCGILHCPEPFQELSQTYHGYEIIELSRIRDNISNLYIVTQTGISKQKMPGFTWQEWSVANVMFIRRSGEFKERVAVGQIHVDALDQAKLEEKWIALI
jgi:hypothetical protein